MYEHQMHAFIKHNKLVLLNNLMFSLMAHRTKYKYKWRVCTKREESWEERLTHFEQISEK